MYLNHPRPATRSPSILTQAFRRQRETIKALLIRDLMIRYRREGLGFAWLILEPAMLIILVMGLWRVIYGPNNHGVSVIPIVLTGYSMLTMWRHVLNRSIFALRLSFDLKYHRQIQYGDALWSRYLLELGGISLAFAIIYSVLLATNQVEPIHDIGYLCLGWGLYAFFSVGFGMCLAALVELRESLERVIPGIMYVTLPLTGSFYMVGWLPMIGREVVLWSPLVHGVEIVRAAFFGPGVATYGDPVFLFVSGLVVNALGWALLDIAKRRVEPLS